MSALGRLANSLLSVNNENTLALANLNFDFTLFKFEAPTEFRSIGNSLSLRRRDDAEQGKIHKTARKLAALFESEVPSTPALLSAYGKRASEIASDPGVNPKGSQEHGPFSDFVGIDGTSLWAAATSGQTNAGAHAALSMNLLACMLARAWDAETATSIWVEMVNERQTEIEKSLDDAPQFISACMAARQDITREELAKWDASARSWLQSADEVKKAAKTKLMLIVNNVYVNNGEGQTTYQKVKNAWRHALIGMENLVQGRPQDASDGSVLLAISSWHIYPDLMVLGSSTKTVKFDDPLVQAGGIITIGLHEGFEGEVPGMHWSLTLSEYRFYERKATVHSHDETTRISMEELLVVALGSLFRAWEISKADEGATAQWLVRLELFVRSTLHDAGQNYEAWLGTLANASRQLLRISKENPAYASQLVAWGRRRATDFLGFRAIQPARFFGLRNRPILEALSTRPGFESGIIHLRSVAREMKLPTARYIIRYRDKHGNFEFATAFPHRRASHKRLLDGSDKLEEVHQRWFMPAVETLDPTRPDFCPALCDCIASGTKCQELCHPGEVRACQSIDESILFRAVQTAAQGEKFIWASSRDITLVSPPPPKNKEKFEKCPHFIWRNPPLMLREHSIGGTSSQGEACPSFSQLNTQCSCALPSFKSTDDLLFMHCYGDPCGLGLFVQVRLKRSHIDHHGPRAHDIANAVSTVSESLVDMEEATALIDKEKINRTTLIGYLDHYVYPLPPSESDRLLESRDILGSLSLLGGRKLHETHLTSLTALSVVEEVFTPLTGYDIPLRAVDLPLSTVGWFDRSKRFYEQDIVRGFYGLDHYEPSLPRAFACIATLESVQHVAASECEGVIAISFGNSIFVAAGLLSDPLNSKAQHEVRRLSGNVDMPGISMMVLPPSPLKIRPLGHDIQIVSHLPYDHKREDNFQGTSLHLSFTRWRRPFNAHYRGTVDERIFFVECVVSVRDRGKWVADIDILARKKIDSVETWIFPCTCEGGGDGEMTSIDSWEEVLDRPETVGVVRAHGNWAARLAALAICQQKGEVKAFIVDPKEGFCPKCAPAQYLEDTGECNGILID